MNKLYIIKIGGNSIDHPDDLDQFLTDFSSLEGLKILVHGGGKIATTFADELGIEAKMVNGRRITDSETLRIVTMVYAGLISKNIIAQLQAKNCNATGLTGADGNLIATHKRPVKDIDYGFVGDIHEASVNIEMLDKLLDAGLIPVFSAITHNGKGQLLNTNADTIASAIAIALSKLYDTTLMYCFEKKGVLRDVKDENSCISELNFKDYTALKSNGNIHEGMLPKLDNAFNAMHHGVKKVIICHAKDLKKQNRNENFGTQLVL